MELINEQYGFNISNDALVEAIPWGWNDTEYNIRVVFDYVPDQSRGSEIESVEPCIDADGNPIVPPDKVWWAPYHRGRPLTDCHQGTLQVRLIDAAMYATTGEYIKIR